MSILPLNFVVFLQRQAMVQTTLKSSLGKKTLNTIALLFSFLCLSSCMLQNYIAYSTELICISFFISLLCSILTYKIYHQKIAYFTMAILGIVIIYLTVILLLLYNT